MAGLTTLLLSGLLAQAPGGFTFEGREASARTERPDGFFIQGPLPFTDLAERGFGGASLSVEDRVSLPGATYGDVGQLSATFRLGVVEYRVELTRPGFPPPQVRGQAASGPLPRPPPHAIGGGVLLDVPMYGESGLGWSAMTRTHAAAAVWGVGSVWRNGQLLTDTAFVHAAALAAGAFSDDDTHRLLRQARPGDTELVVLVWNLPANAEPRGFVQFVFENVDISVGGVGVSSRAFVENTGNPPVDWLALTPAPSSGSGLQQGQAGTGGSGAAGAGTTGAGATDPATARGGTPETTPGGGTAVGAAGGGRDIVAGPGGTVVTVGGASTTGNSGAGTGGSGTAGTGTGIGTGTGAGTGIGTGTGTGIGTGTGVGTGPGTGFAGAGTGAGTGTGTGAGTGTGFSPDTGFGIGSTTGAPPGLAAGVVGTPGAGGAALPTGTTGTVGGPVTATTPAPAVGSGALSGTGLPSVAGVAGGALVTPPGSTAGPSLPGSEVPGLPVTPDVTSGTFPVTGAPNPPVNISGVLPGTPAPGSGLAQDGAVVPGTPPPGTPSGFGPAPQAFATPNFSTAGSFSVQAGATGGFDAFVGTAQVSPGIIATVPPLNSDPATPPPAVLGTPAPLNAGQAPPLLGTPAPLNSAPATALPAAPAPANVSPGTGTATTGPAAAPAAPAVSPGGTGVPPSI